MLGRTGANSKRARSKLMLKREKCFPLFRCLGPLKSTR